jgi:predicted RNA binding protein YcfA (HicA-like mRNA interferase family)
MKLPRDLAGEALIRCLCRSWGYREIQQVGSHVVLETAEPSHQRIVVPAHKSLRVGTLNGILRLVADHKGVSRQEILDTLR